MSEVRNRREGALYWIAASGSGSSWATASAASGVLLGFVRDFNFGSAQTVVTVADRGTPSHHKVTDKQPQNLSFTIAWANTAQFPVAVSGSGASVPMLHLEFKATAPEAAKAYWYQFYGVPVSQIQFTEGDQENTLAYTCVALGMNGPTASGYIGA
jgi:hypothetical protein